MSNTHPPAFNLFPTSLLTHASSVLRTPCCWFQMTRLPANTAFKLWRPLPAVTQLEWKVGSDSQHQRDSAAAAAAAHRHTLSILPLLQKRSRETSAGVRRQIPVFNVHMKSSARPDDLTTLRVFTQLTTGACVRNMGRRNFPHGYFPPSRHTKKCGVTQERRRPLVRIEQKKKPENKQTNK